MGGGGGHQLLELVPFSWQYFGWSVLIGILSAVSLPLGSLLGLQWQPASVTTGIMESFGGGALLAALSVTMVAPISLSASDQSLDPEVRDEYKKLLIVVVVCSILGGCFFILLDELITRKGGELRKLYGQVRYYGVTPGLATEVEAKKMRTVQSSTIFRVLAPAKQKELAHLLKPLHFHENDILFCKGDTLNRLYFIRHGNVELQSEPGQAYWVADPGDVLGTTAIVTDSPSQLTGIASTDVECLFVPAEWLEETMEEEPMLKYLMLKSMLAQNAVFMEVDEKMHAHRRNALQQISDRFKAEMLATEEAAFANIPGGVPADLREPLMDPEAAEARRNSISQRPALGEPSCGRRTSIQIDEDIDTLIDMVIDGEMEPEDPHEVIRQQLDNIYFGDSEDQDNWRTDSISKGHAGSHLQNILSPSGQHEESKSFSLGRRSLTFNFPKAALGQANRRSSLTSDLEEAATRWMPHQRPAGSSKKESANGNGNLAMAEQASSNARKQQGPADQQPQGATNAVAGKPENGRPLNGLEALREHHSHKFSDDSSHMRKGSKSSTVSLAGIDVSPLTGPLETEWHASGNTRGTAPLAVFLGILLDGIPESIVIGVKTSDLIRTLAANGSPVTLGAVIPYTLIAGLFLSNFPEALASSMHMYKYGWSKFRILIMWTSILIVTAVGAGLGYALANTLSEPILVGVEGFAAGAMLTMIASSMIPEAVHLCGASWTGISVLWGFMATNLFQLI